MAKQGKPLAPGEAYKGRRADVAVLNCTVPRETTALIKAYSGGGKKIGTFIALLFQDYHSKQLEGKRLIGVLQKEVGKPINLQE